MKRLLIFTAITLLLFAVPTTGSALGGKHTDKILKEIHNPRSKYVLVASHRGDWRNYPENSLEAIESVIEMGVDIVEIDLAMTKDSVLILMHDRNIDRTTSGRGMVRDITYDSVKHCTLKLSHGVVSRYQIPTLQQALELCKDRIVINIDKGYEYYDQVMHLLEQTGTANQVLIKGYSKPATVAKKFAQYKINMLYMPIIDYRKATAGELFQLYMAGKAPLAYEIVWDRMSPEIAKTCAQVVSSGAKLWTNSLWDSLCGGLEDDRALKDPEGIYGAHLALGATMIQTDRPQLLLDYLRKRGLHD